MIPALIVGSRRVLYVAPSFRDYDFRVGHCGAGRVGNDSANRGGKRLAPGETSNYQEETADSRHRCEEFHRTSIRRMNWRYLARFGRLMIKEETQKISKFCVGQVPSFF